VRISLDGPDVQERPFLEKYYETISFWAEESLYWSKIKERYRSNVKNNVRA
jgi:hypothetical protein